MTGDLPWVVLIGTTIAHDLTEGQWCYIWVKPWTSMLLCELLAFVLLANNTIVVICLLSNQQTMIKRQWRQNSQRLKNWSYISVENGSQWNNIKLNMYSLLYLKSLERQMVEKGVCEYSYMIWHFFWIQQTHEHFAEQRCVIGYNEVADGTHVAPFMELQSKAMPTCSGVPLVKGKLQSLMIGY